MKQAKNPHGASSCDKCGGAPKKAGVVGVSYSKVSGRGKSRVKGSGKKTTKIY